jgi:hypothetical protein
MGAQIERAENVEGDLAVETKVVATDRGDLLAVFVESEDLKKVRDAERGKEKKRTGERDMTDGGLGRKGSEQYQLPFSTGSCQL